MLRNILMACKYIHLVSFNLSPQDGFQVAMQPYLIVAWQQMNLCIASRNLHLTVLTNGFYCRISTKPPPQIQRDGILGIQRLVVTHANCNPFLRGGVFLGSQNPKCHGFRMFILLSMAVIYLKLALPFIRKKLSRRNISKSTLYLKFTTPNCNYWMKLVMMEWCENIVTHCNKKQ